MEAAKEKNNYLVKVNQMMLRIYIAIGIVFILGSYVQFKRGSKSLAYLVGVTFVCTAAYIVGYFTYKKLPDSKKVGIRLAAAYGGVYVVTLLNTTVQSTFAFAVPFLLLLLLYKDRKITAVSATVVGCSIIGFLIRQVSLGITSDITLISGTTIIFIPVFIMVNKSIRQLSEENENSIKEAAEKNEQLEDMLNELDKIVENVKDNSNELKYIVNEFGQSTLTVNKAVEEISFGATETATEIEHETILIDEIKTKIDDASKSMIRAKDNSLDTESVVKEGLKTVESLSEKSKFISEKNARVSDSMKELANKSSNIATITNVISEIANQTNLLALNAAIEAARVGEAGKGFAVVSEEIKKLAEECKNNANNIDNILKELEKDTVESVKQVEELVKETEEQQKLVDNTDRAFNSIKSNVEIVSKEIEDVSNKMNEVLTGSEKIYESISSLSAISEETMANAEETTTISKNNLEKLQVLESISNSVDMEVSNIEKYFN